MILGRIDVGEIQLSLRSLGLNVSTEQASRILQRLEPFSFSQTLCFLFIFSA